MYQRLQISQREITTELLDDSETSTIEVDFEIRTAHRASDHISGAVTKGVARHGNKLTGTVRHQGQGDVQILEGRAIGIADNDIRVGDVDCSAIFCEGYRKVGSNVVGAIEVHDWSIIDRSDIDRRATGGGELTTGALSISRVAVVEFPRDVDGCRWRIAAVAVSDRLQRFVDACLGGIRVERQNQVAAGC